MRKSRLRDRILQAACELFDEHGTRAVSVKVIAAAAGTNTTSFYRIFDSKDELTLEYVTEKSSQFWVWWDNIIALYPGKPSRQIEAIFDSLFSNGTVSGFGGYVFSRMSVEISAPEHAARRASLDIITEMWLRFCDLAAQGGVNRASELGDGLILLIEGANISWLTFGTPGGPSVNATLAVRVLLQAYSCSPL